MRGEVRQDFLTVHWREVRVKGKIRRLLSFQDLNYHVTNQGLVFVPAFLKSGRL